MSFGLFVKTKKRESQEMSHWAFGNCDRHLSICCRPTLLWWNQSHKTSNISDLPHLLNVEIKRCIRSVVSTLSFYVCCFLPDELQNFFFRSLNWLCCVWFISSDTETFPKWAKSLLFAKQVCFSSFFRSGCFSSLLDVLFSFLSNVQESERLKEGKTQARMKGEKTYDGWWCKLSLSIILCTYIFCQTSHLKYIYPFIIHYLETVPIYSFFYLELIWFVCLHNTFTNSWTINKT